MRIIFAGSSARSSRSVTLAAMMSRVREKIPIGTAILPSDGLTACFAGAVPIREKTDFLGLSPLVPMYLANKW